MHIDINMNIDITPRIPTPCRGRPHINMNIDIHVINNMNVEYYIDYYTLLIPY